MILIKNVEVYAPEYLGIKDILISGRKVEKIMENIDCGNLEVDILNGRGKSNKII